MPMFAGRVVPYTKRSATVAGHGVARQADDGDIPDRIEPHLAVNEFVAGEAFTVADITGFLHAEDDRRVKSGTSRAS